MDLNYKKEITIKDGRKVILRYPKMQDIASLMNFVNKITQENTFTNFIKGKKYSLAEETKYLKNMVKNLQLGKQLHIAAYNDNQYIGKADLIPHNTPSEKHIASLGIALDKDFRGLWLGTYLLQELISQAHFLKGIKIIVLTAAVQNQPAIKLYSRLGFKKYGLLPKGHVVGDKFYDLINMYLNI